MSNIPSMPDVMSPGNSPDSTNAPKEAETISSANVPNMPDVETIETSIQQSINHPPSVSQAQMKDAFQGNIDVELSEAKTSTSSLPPNDLPEGKVEQTKEAAGTVLLNASLSSDHNPTKGVTSEAASERMAGPNIPLERSSTTYTTQSTISTNSSTPVVSWKETSDNFFNTYSGQDWQNALCLVAVTLITYVFASIGLGFSWCIVVLVFAAQYYINSIQRFRRNTRDDISRELSITKLFTDTESTEWLNAFLSKFWLLYEPALSATIVGITDGILAASTPAFLDSLRLSEFTLGSKAPRIESVKTFSNEDEETVEMEWDVSFTPNDLEDLTRHQFINKTNPKIVLEVRVGKGIVGAGMTVLVEDISFSGRMRVKMRLVSNFPHMQSVELSFMEPPSFDYSLKPVGGETFGFDVTHIPGLASFIREQVHAVLGPMMYNPNVFSLNMEQMIGGVDAEAAIGVLRIHIRHARNLKNLEVLGLSDPYVRLHINNRAELGRTTYKENTLNPFWDETFYLLIHNLNETLSLEVFDKEEIKKDRILGTATFNLASLLDEPDQDHVIAKVIREGGKEHGEVCFDVTYCPVIEPTIQEDGTSTQIESNQGILKVFVHQAKDLSHKASAKHNPYCVVKLRGTMILTTKVLKRKANPVWEEAVETFVKDKSTAVLSFDIIDARGVAADPVLGKFSIGLNEALKRMEDQNQWFNLHGHSKSKVRLSFVWKPVEITGGIIPAGHLASPIGVVRLDIIGAKNLKNVEKIGKSDPYVVVSVSGRTLCRTEVIGNNLNPSWNETHYIGIRSPREVIYFDVYDFDKVGKDRRLGSTSLPAKQIFGRQVSKYQWGPGAPKDLKLSLHLEGKERGEIHLKASFNPFIELDSASEVVIPEPLEASQSLTTTITALERTKPIDYTQYTTGLLSVIVGHTKGMKHHLDTVYADILLNNNEYNVVHRTKTKKRVTNPNFDEECEVFIQEAQFATISVYIREMNDERTVIARKTIDLPSILEQLSREGSEEGYWYEFENTDGKILLKFKFSPVEIQIDESESWINKGLVKVKILKAQGLRAADSSGTSDPYVLVKHNGDKVYKTKVIKKTLSPVFNEEFSVPILARNEASLIFEVYDWNQVQSSEHLGYLQINTKNLEPLTWIQDDYPLTNGTGTLTLKIMFRPEHVGRMTTDRKQTFQEATKSVIGKGVGGATKVVGGTIGGIGKGVGGLFSLGKKPTNHGSIVAPPPNTNVPLETMSTRSNSVNSNFSNDVLDISNLSNITNTPNMPNMPNEAADPQSDVNDIKPPVVSDMGNSLTSASPKPSISVKEEVATTIGESINESDAKNDSPLPINEPQEEIPLTNDDTPTSIPLLVSEPKVTVNSASAPQSPITDVSHSRLSIANLDDVSEISGESVGLENYGEEHIGEQGMLTIGILQAKDLIAADSNGLSDPYVRVRSGRKMLYKTKAIKKTLEPKWNESFTIPLSGSLMKLNFSVRDRNLLQDAYLGEYETNVWEHLQPNNQATEGKWVDLRKAEHGKLLLRFIFTPSNSPKSSEVIESHSSSPRKKLGFSTFRRKH